MSKIGTLALLWALTISFVSPKVLASEAGAKAKSCPHLLTIDERFRELRQSEPSEARLRTQLTLLLGDAFTPVIKEINSYIINLSETEIINAAELAEVKPDHRDSAQIDEPLTPWVEKLGFDAVYEGLLNKRSDHIPFTSFSYQTMWKLKWALSTLKKLTEVINVDADPTLLSGTILLKTHTFSKQNIREVFEFANLSVLQSGAQMTANPVGSLSAEEILIEAMTQRGERASLVTMHSLMLPPALLGPNGSGYYVRDALVINDDGRLGFSPKYRAFLKKNKEYFNTEIQKDPNEFGHGCPVAHCVGRDQKAGLQYYLDAVLYIYQRLP